MVAAAFPFSSEQPLFLKERQLLERWVLEQHPAFWEAALLLIVLRRDDFGPTSLLMMLQSPFFFGARAAAAAAWRYGGRGHRS